MTPPPRVEAMRMLRGAISLLDDRSELDIPAYDRILTAALTAFRREHEEAMSDNFKRGMHRNWQREAVRKAKAGARAQGCTCDVEIVFDLLDHPLPGPRAVTVRHDDWCPLLRLMEEREPGLARTQFMFYREDAS